MADDNQRMICPECERTGQRSKLYMPEMYSSTAMGGNWSIGPGPQENAPWAETPPATSAFFKFADCGCTLTVSADSPPVRVWECEHGNVIRAANA